MFISRRTVPAILTMALALSIALFRAPETEASENRVVIPPRFFALLAEPVPQAAGGDAKSADPLPDGKGKDVVKRVCTACHAVTQFASQRHTQDEWDAIIQSMISKGLDAPDEDLTTISNYLGTYLGPKKPAPAAPADSNSSH